jgi:hypothetical protein
LGAFRRNIVRTVSEKPRPFPPLTYGDFNYGGAPTPNYARLLACLGVIVSNSASERFDVAWLGRLDSAVAAALELSIFWAVD